MFEIVTALSHAFSIEMPSPFHLRSQRSSIPRPYSRLLVSNTYPFYSPVCGSRQMKFHGAGANSSPVPSPVEHDQSDRYLDFKAIISLFLGTCLDQCTFPD